MGKEDTSLIIRVSLPEQEEVTQGDEREAFWGWVRERSHPNDRKKSAPTFEAELRRSFGRKLQRFLVTHFHTGWQGSSNIYRDERAFSVPIPDVAELLPLVLFEVRELSYGSLTLGVEVAGINNLVKLFDNNFDVFMSFLRTYIPGAFRATVGGQTAGQFLAYEFLANELSFDVVAASGLRHSFDRIESTAHGNKITENSALLAPTKAHAIWLIANASLVVPVIFALVVLYVAFQGVNEKRKQLAIAEKQIYQNQQTLMISYEARVTELEKLNQELVTILQKDAAPADANP